MNAEGRGRRRFLKDAALAGLVAGTIRSASAQTGGPEGSNAMEAAAKDPRIYRAYGVRSRFETAAREINTPQAHNPIQEQQAECYCFTGL